MTPSQPLHAMHCVPCEGGTQPLRHDEFQQYLPIIPSWTVASDEKSIHKKFKFGNFRSALQFVNAVGEVAESEGHHPDINLHDWKFVSITLTTHAIGGLSINDFVLASKIDLLQLPTA